MASYVCLEKELAGKRLDGIFQNMATFATIFSTKLGNTK
jgi:hypothetical protein